MNFMYNTAIFFFFYIAEVKKSGFYAHFMMMLKALERNNISH